MVPIQDQSQNQAEYELQPQEYYQYEQPTQDLTLALDHDPYQEEEDPQGPQDPSDAMESEPQAQQQFQQPPQYGNPQQFQQPPQSGNRQQVQQPPQYGNRQQVQQPPQYGNPQQVQQPPQYGNPGQFQLPPQYGNPQAQPNPAFMPQQTQQVSRPQNPQMNAMNANQLVPYPLQSPQPLPPQQSPQLQVFPHGPSQPQGFSTGMHGYQAPPSVLFPPASGGQPNPASMPQQTQQVSRPQNPQMNAMNANQLVPYPLQSPQPLPPQQSPQLQVFPHGPSQPQGFSTGMHGYQAPPPVPFPPASGGHHGVPAPPHKPPVAVVSGILVPPAPVNAEYWRSGLFDCMNDPTNALVPVFLPCVTFGQVAEIVDRGHTSCATSGLLYGLIAYLIGLPCIMSCTYRTKMRSMYNLSESPGPDRVVHCLCKCCALCQEYRELQARGLDPSIGWSRNAARSQIIQMQHGAMVPPRSQTMML
ncbi:hypothetical protein PVL29_022182 [Vitis rotundifolia]|uniref:Uncharacterized protein n=1 Tax=Vitis rotundifolia TaxID=103349 RepID=A0AA38YUV6_VITRO|nr:hypothetical protein PVL29_022182 [Vitis rotundifolia]